MGQYTVQAGDTLSGIGAKFGVPYQQITGYKSGNPNLIYPGETVSWGSNSAPSPSGGVATASSNLPSWAPPQTNLTAEKAAATTAAAAAPGQVIDQANQIKGGIEDSVNRYKQDLPGIIQSNNAAFNVPSLQDQANQLNDRINTLQMAPNLMGSQASMGSVDKALQTSYMPAYQAAEQNFLGASAQSQNLTSIMADPYKQDINALTQLGTQTLASYSNAIDTNVKTLLAMPQISLDQQKQLNDLAVVQAQINQANYAAELGLRGAQAQAGATIAAANTAANATIQAAKIDQASKLAVIAMASGATMNGDGTLNTSKLNYQQYQSLVGKLNSNPTASTNQSKFDQLWGQYVGTP